MTPPLTPEDLEPSNHERFLKRCHEHGTLAIRQPDGKFWCAFAGGHHPNEVDVYDPVARAVVKSEGQK